MEKIIGLIIKRNRLEQNMSQETLCRGICVVSYLSKIESGLVKADMEIIIKLFKELGINFIEEVSKDDENEIYKVLDGAFVDSVTLDNIKEVKARYSYLLYSSKALTYIFLEFLIKILESSEDFQEREFLSYENYADRKELYYFYMILGMFYIHCKFNREKSIFYFEKAYMINPQGKGLFNIGISYYIDGDYNRAIECFNNDFNLQIELGNIDDAISNCIYLGSSYSNLNSTPLMDKYYNKALNLSKNVDDEFKKSVYYNLGATYIKFDYDKSLYYLKKAEKIKNEQNDFYLFQKLTLLNINMDNKEEAIKYLGKCKEVSNKGEFKGQPYIEDMVKMMDMLCMDSNYLKNQEYGNVLRRLFYAKTGKFHHGFKLYFASYYIQWLKANRKYKEALEVMEEIFPF